MDITQLILDDHHEQRRLFAILEQVGRSDTQTLSAVWGRLGAFLELHAAAEEAIFYPALLRAGIVARRKAGVEDETLDAIGDHNEIRDAIAEVARHPVGTDGWYVAVAGANMANGDHMAEEEREGLTDFRRLASLTERHDLAVSFAAYEARNFAGVKPVDKDPAAYISQVEAGQVEAGTWPAGDGSLRIGGLLPMRLLLIGAPGAGKGTQAEKLAERFGITHISSGDLLRQHVREQTAIGQTIKAYVDAGDLVPDAVVMDMLRKPVIAATEAGGYVLDGFPRTVDQAKAAFEVAHALGVEVQAAVHLEVPDEELIRRLLARGRGSDDTEEVIAHRLRVYREKTIPLLEYYAGREWMFAVDGTREPEQVHEDIVTRLRKLTALGRENGLSRS